MDFSQFLWLWPIAPIWVAGVIGFSIFRRKNAGKALFPKPAEGATFIERGASGRSLMNFWSRIGGARNCLIVSVTRTDIFITPMFPFNLMFLPDIYGLELQVERESIVTVEQRSGFLGSTVIVRWGQGNAFELQLRNPDDFMRAVGKS